MLDAYKQKVEVDPIATFALSRPRKVRKLHPTRHVGVGGRSLYRMQMAPSIPDRCSAVEGEISEGKGMYGRRYGIAGIYGMPSDE